MIRVFLLVAVLSLAFPVFAQSPDQIKEQIETNKRIGEALRKPTFISLRLVFMNRNTDELTDLAPLYRSTDRITVRVILNHSFNEPVSITYTVNPYRDIELELQRDGEVVPYKKEAQVGVERARTEPPNESSATYRYLPGKDYVEPGWVNLWDWYETLPPGHYKLTVRRRFTWGGDWAQSDSVTFDISGNEA